MADWVSPNFEAMPSALKQLPWAVWKAEPRSEPGKFSKAPCSPTTGRKVGANKPELFGTFAEAQTAFGRGDWTGAGVLLTGGGELVGIDLDDVKARGIPPEVDRALMAYADAGGYVELSPSGKGGRAFCLGELPPGSNRRDNVEVYNDKRFLTVTGHVMPSAAAREIKPAQELIDAIVAFISPQKGAARPQETPTQPPATVVPGPEPIAHSELVERVCGMAKAASARLFEEGAAAAGISDLSRADQTLANDLAEYAIKAGASEDVLAQVVEEVFSRSKLAEREKWQNRKDYRDSTIRKAVERAKASGVTATAGNIGAQGGVGGAAGGGSVLDELNERYTVGVWGGKTLVFDLSNKEDILGAALRPSDFTALHANRKIEGKGAGQAWLNWTGRRTLDGLIFDPAKAPGMTGKTYNLWPGLAVTPARGDCHLILKHIRGVLCGGDSRQFKYLIRWLALMMQRPHRKPGVAIVARSGEGAGKGTITNMICDILGRSAYGASQAAQVVGQFNGHLMHRVFVVMEEAVWSGDHKGTAQAKTLITEPALSYEYKGANAESRPSFHHVWMNTNEGWAVPASADARRYCVLDVSNRHANDYAYFELLHRQINSGGKEAFLDFLMHVDLAKFNPYDIPSTAALAEQKKETLQRTEPDRAWWLGALEEGCIEAMGVSYPFGGAIPTGGLRESYEASVKHARNARVKSFDLAMRELKAVLPGARPLHRRRLMTNGARVHEYDLPDLADAKRAFFEATGVSIA